MKENIPLSRREFLKTSGKSLAGVGATFLPSISATAELQDQKKEQRPSLKGSKENEATARALAEKYNLAIMKTDEDMARMLENGSLVKIPIDGVNYYIDEIGIDDKGNVYPGNRDFLYVARPWVGEFIETEAKLFAAAFPGVKLKITSLARNNEYQIWLREHNNNAASDSVHLTGSVVDISKFLTPGTTPKKERKLMQNAQLVYMRKRLLLLKKLGFILPTEENYQATFHIFVTPEYQP